MQELMIDGKTLRMKDVEAVARGGVKVGLDAAAADEIRSSRRVVEQILASGEVMYGINTGFGKLAEVRIPDGELATLQLNLLRSHCVGTGEPFPEEVVRAMLLLRANVLATGRAGCRVEVVEKVLEMLNAGVLPVVPSQGSVGASGDLAPLAHLAIVLVGEGEAVYRGRKMPGGEALAAAGIDRPASAVIEDMRRLHSVLTLQKGKRKPVRRLETPTKTQAVVLSAFGHAIDGQGVLRKLSS